jgi:Ca2+-dependent lipid-binding protein
MEGGLLDVLMPPQIDTVPHLLKLNIRQLAKLMIMDSMSKSSDPFVLIKFAGVENRTSTFKNKLDVGVHECVTIPVKEPVATDVMNVHVFDYDLAASNDLIGAITLSYKDIKGTNDKRMPDAWCMPNRWFHLYGAPLGKDDGMYTYTNQK